MINTIIVDDELSAGEILQTLIKKYAPQVTICSICLNIPQALEAIKTYQPKVIFLDIELADGSGFEVVEHLNRLETRIVFVTAYEHYALQAIKHNAFDYILKPIMPEELKRALEKIFDDEIKQTPYPDISNLLKQLSGGLGNKIAVNNRNSLEYYDITEIVFIEGQGSYVYMHLSNNQKVLVSKKIKDFEWILNGKGFLRIHKSYFINTAHISSLLKEDGGYVKMSNGSKLSISNTYKESVINNIKSSSNIV